MYGLLLLRLLADVPVLFIILSESLSSILKEIGQRAYNLNLHPSRRTSFFSYPRKAFADTNFGHIRHCGSRIFLL